MADFDRQFSSNISRAQRMAKWALIIYGVVALGVLGFGIWVVIMLMRHFGVI